MQFPVNQDVSSLSYATQCLRNLKGRSFASLNMRGILSKFDSLKPVIEYSNVDVFALCESFLNPNISDSEISIDGYSIVRGDRDHRSGKLNGGGLIMYTNDDADITPIPDGHFCSPNIECQWVVLKLTKARPVFICNTYRPPDASVQDSLYDLESHRLRLDIPHNADVLYMGDINIDFASNSLDKRKLIHFLKSHGLEQVITDFTRITPDSQTLIDPIWCNNTAQFAHRGCLDLGLSDHCLIFTSRKRAKPSRAREVRFIRSYRTFDPIAFALDVSQTDWSPVYNENDVHVTTSIFQSIFMNVLDKHLPNKRIRCRINSAPWVTPEFFGLIDRREYWARQCRMHPCELYYELKKAAQRSVQRLKNQLKADYVRSSIERHKNDAKKLWRDIRSFWPNSKSNKKNIQRLNGLSKKEDIANLLNDHFCTVGEKVQGGISGNSTLEDFPPPPHPPIFDLRPVCIDDVCEVINGMKSSQSCSIDGITSNIVKAAKTELCPVLTYLFNLSIVKKCFPDCWKLASVTPLFKSGDTNSCDNYRPISVLPTLGKCLERIVYNQCIKYMNVNNLLTDCQAGFRERHSTGACLADFLNEIYEEVDGGGSCGVLFLDLAKAFDTVDHHILEIKLRALGFKVSTVSWFSSYLSNRKQATKIGNVFSNTRNISCGVPQGSILGPFLFLCYVNDLPSHLLTTSSFLFADDMALIVRGYDPLQIEMQLNEELVNIAKWFDANKLAMNLKKTKVMHFRHCRNIRNNVELNIALNGEVVESVQQFKYLGVTLDINLSFDAHIEILCGKVNSRNCLLRRVRNFVSKDLALSLYRALIEPHYRYCDYIYSGCSLTNARKLQVTQNNSLRAITRSDYQYPTEQLHTDLGIEWLDVQAMKSVCIEMYKNVNNLNPVRNCQKVNWVTHERCLRSADNAELVIKRTKTKLADMNMFVRGPRTWLVLPVDMRKIETLSGFKRAIKLFDGFEHVR